MSLVQNLEILIKQQNDRVDWNTYFSCLTLLISSRSSCKRLHVGCVLVKENRVLATGYNGFLANAPHKSIVINNHEQATVHAEQNAICYAAKNGLSLNGATAYVTHYPCLNCCKSLLSSGITKINFLHNYKNDPLVEVFCKQLNVEINKIS